MSSGGKWKNVIEMEDCLTLDELYLLVDAKHRAEHEHRKFLAALKGIDLDEETKNSEFEETQLMAQAELAGKSKQEYVFDMIGIEIEDDDD